MKIVLAVDDSPASQTVLDSAVNRVWLAQAKFCVLNIVDVQRFERLPALIEDATRESQWLVDKAAEKMRGAGLDVVTRSSPGHPRSDISCFAKEWGADLILVGSHGHGAIARFLLGSVAQGVLRTAPCSWLLRLDWRERWIRNAFAFERGRAGECIRLWKWRTPGHDKELVTGSNHCGFRHTLPQRLHLRRRGSFCLRAIEHD